MPNILLTTGCNLACEYCFAKEKMAGRRQDMTMENVRKIISFLKRSDYPYFRVMGGEPTLHKQFREIVTLALREGFHVTVLSNATWKEELNEFFAAVSPRHLNFLINVDHPDNYTNHQWSRIEDNLQAISPAQKPTLSFNIYEKQPRFEYILDLCRRFNIKNIRMSFSLPVLDTNNAHLNIEDYADLSSFIMESVKRTEAEGIQMLLDNAVPLCIFDYAQAGELIYKGVLNLDHNASCRPLIDIGPDLTVWNCFCLSALENRRLEEFDNLWELKDFYQGILDKYQHRIYPMDKCYDCTMRHHLKCQGGCLTYAINKQMESSSREEQAISEFPSWQETTILKLSDKTRVSQYSIPKESYVLSHSDTDTQVELGKSFRSIYPLLNGQYQARDIIDKYLANDRSEEAMNPIEKFRYDMMREGISNLLQGLIKKGFLEN